MPQGGDCLPEPSAPRVAVDAHGQPLAVGFGLQLGNPRANRSFLEVVAHVFGLSVGGA